MCNQFFSSNYPGQVKVKLVWNNKNSHHHGTCYMDKNDNLFVVNKIIKIRLSYIFCPPLTLFFYTLLLVNLKWWDDNHLVGISQDSLIIGIRFCRPIILSVCIACIAITDFYFYWMFYCRIKVLDWVETETILFWKGQNNTKRYRAKKRQVQLNKKPVTDPRKQTVEPWIWRILIRSRYKFLI